MTVELNRLVKCMPDDVVPSRGIWLGNNPFRFFGPAVMFQISISVFSTGIVDFFLRRFGICSYFSYMIGAFIISPSTFLGGLVFSSPGLYTLEIFEYIGPMFCYFLVGLKMDFRMVSGSGRKALFIGLAVGFLPVFVTYCTVLFIGWFIPSKKLSLMLCSVAVSESQTSFFVVACLLDDLKILNSEIGRLAVASSMISNACSSTVMMMLMAARESKDVGLKGYYMIASMLGIILFITYVFGPIMHWLMKQIPQGTKKMQESHVFLVIVMILVSGFLWQCTGHPPVIGSFILGLTVPPGPPLAETLEDKLETFVSILLPLFYVACSGKSTLEGYDFYTLRFVLLIIAIAFFVKIIATVIPSLCCGVSFNDSIVLSLILASFGLVDLVRFSSAFNYHHINAPVFSVLMYSSVVTAGVTSISVKVMYKPSTDNLACNKSTLEDIMQNTKFQILACVYQDFNVPSIIGLLEASNATNESPINLYLLRLIELQRISPPFLVSHKRNDNYSIYYKRSKHILNAFRSYEKQYKKTVLLNAFSALSPCATMHRDICSLAEGKGVSLIILPFHRQFNMDGIMESNTSIRNVNSSVLKLAPCSVGILIDRRCMTVGSSMVQSKSFFHIALIFLGGPDDREVLTYGMRMIENPDTILTVIRFDVMGDMSCDLIEDKKFDAKYLNDFRRKYMGMGRITYREEVVSNVLEIAKAMREIDDNFDLIMVGRQHGNESIFFKGLSEWNEYPELGFMGDMLATSDLQEDVPILVLQQKYQNPDDFVRKSNCSVKFSPRAVRFTPNFNSFL